MPIIGDVDKDHTLTNDAGGPSSPESGRHAAPDRLRRLVKTLLIASAALFQPPALWAAPPRSSPAIWFSPRSGPNELTELMPLFQPESPWQQVASHIRVFEISGGAARNGSESEIRAIAVNLKRRQIALGLGMSPLSGRGNCGRGVEGYSAPRQPLADARRLQALGGDATYESMDEPLYYGHVFDGDNACRSPIAEIAHEVAAKVKDVQTVYPTVKIGDVEPVGGESSTSLADLEEWFSAYRAAAGQELAFFRADIQWNRPWQDQMLALSNLLHNRGVPLQIIYNGNAQSDEEWVEEATHRFQEYESSERRPPAVAVFQCWTENPTQVLPEADPSTLTGLVKHYVEWQQSR
jgi:hypothetical protein